MTQKPIDETHLGSDLVREAAADGGLTDGWLGKRAAPRIQFAVHLDLEIAGEIHYVRCINVSADGLLIMNRDSIPPKQLNDVLRVRRTGDPEDAWARVRVQHVTQTVGGYKIGLAYVD